MKKITLFFTPIIVLALVLGGCSGVESKYDKICGVASNALTDLKGGIDTMTSYEYSKKYQEIEGQYNTSVEALKLEVADSESDTEKLNTVLKDFASLDASVAAIEVLNNKNKIILDSIVNKKWIRIDPKGEGDKDTNLVFYFTDSLIVAQGYKKKFPYELKDGNIYTESIGNIYCALNDSTLLLQDDAGIEANYRLATINEQLAGYWICTQSMFSMVFKKNGTCTFPNYRDLYAGKYTYKDNKLTVTANVQLPHNYYITMSLSCKYNPEKDIFNIYNFYNSFDEKNYSKDETLSRSEKKGPKSLSILFSREGDED